MSGEVQEKLKLEGGAQLPHVVSAAALATDGSGNIGAAARSSLNFTTASVAANVSTTNDVTLAKIAKAIKISTNHPARVRAYSTSAYRTNDAARSVNTDPTGDHGCLLEVVTTGSVLSLDLAPAASLHNMDGTPASTIYFAVQNLDVSTETITVTLTVLIEET